jgi:hypothetical protein
MDETPHCAIEVGEYGHHYFNVDRDRSKGDRRSDGKLNADFFAVGESSLTIDNVRVSQRLRTKKRDVVEVESGTESPEEVKNQTNEVDVVADSLEEVQNNPNERDSPRNVISRGPRLPAQCIKCAGRQRTTRLLWLREFCIVNGDQRPEEEKRCVVCN